MSSCRCLGVLALAWCFAWAAGQESSVQSRTAHTSVRSPKLVSTELRLNAEGNAVTRCVVLSIPVPEKVQTTASNTTLAGSSPTCPPSETPTPVYDPESLFGALTDATSDVSFIQEEAKNYFVYYNGDRSFSKAQVLEVILVAILGSVEDERIAVGVNVLKSQIGALRKETPQVVFVCVPDGLEGGRVLDDCTPNEAVANGGVTEDAVSSKMSYVEAGVTIPFGEKFKKGDVHQGIKTVIDLLQGSMSPTGSSRQSPAIATTDSTKAQPPHPLAPPNSRQTATATLQLSVSGWAGLPFSVSKVSAELSLSFAPATETNASFIFPSRPRASISKSPPLLTPTRSSLTLPQSTSPDTMSMTGQTSSTATTPMDTILPQSPANFTNEPVNSSQVYPATAVSSTATAAPSVSLQDISSPPPWRESTPPSYPSPGSPTTTPGASTTKPQFSTQPGL